MAEAHTIRANIPSELHPPLFSGPPEPPSPHCNQDELFRSSASLSVIPAILSSATAGRRDSLDAFDSRSKAE